MAELWAVARAAKTVVAWVGLMDGCSVALMVYLMVELKGAGWVEMMGLRMARS
jgi:hypothetical protein